jgi:hypothetical protein
MTCIEQSRGYRKAHQAESEIAEFFGLPSTRAGHSCPPVTAHAMTCQHGFYHGCRHIGQIHPRFQWLA